MTRLAICAPACNAFEQYCMGAVTISKAGLAVVQRLLAGEKVDQASSGMSAREWRELMDSLGQK